jgi:hypothetical protein
VLFLQTEPVAERLRVREIDDDRRLVRIVRRDSGSVVTWRRAQMVPLSAQGMDAAGIGKVAFTSQDQNMTTIAVVPLAASRQSCAHTASAS